MMTDYSDGESGIIPLDLQVNYELEPNNIPPDEPRFSWRVDSTTRGAHQTAYRVLVARSEEALAEERGSLWDSGKVERPNSTDVAYDGPTLTAGTDYYWTVRIWDEDGKPSEWADLAMFSTALADASDWVGNWIGYSPGEGDSNGYRSHWHRADVEEWIQVDLGEATDIARIELHPADPFNGPETPDGMPVSAVYSEEEISGDRVTADGPGGFGFPVRYCVKVSDDPDFKQARTVVDRTNEDQANPGSDPVSFAVDTDKARYVRVTATNLYEFDPASTPQTRGPQVKTEYLREERRPWKTFAFAALAVCNSDGDDLAVKQPVKASSSIETDTWGRDHLVNGHYESRTAPGSPLLRTEVDLAKDVRHARAHVCGLGYGELYINGKRMGDEVLNPAWTQYDERVCYSTYDVGDQLKSGVNALGLWLGRGWFSRNARDWTGFGSPRAILQLEIEYKDGITRTVSTDSSWCAALSPILENDLYDGEVYDAREEQDGWAEPGFDDANWDGATVVDTPGGDLVPQRIPPIRVTETVEPEEVFDHEEGPIIDFGQNLVGWINLTVQDVDAGDEIELRHAEALQKDGSLSRVDLRTADATDRYIARGNGAEEYEPRFTYHGFRYAQIVGYPGEFDPEHVCAKVVHTDIKPIGSFDCSNEDLSKLQQNTEWGLRGNIHGILTDCPQRDERFGWTGDNHIAARALLYNFDGSRFYEKWMDDHEDVRSEHGYVADTIPHGYGTIPEDPTWGITQVTVPWHLYRHYGDVGVLERHYEGMRRYVDFWHSESEDGIIPDEYGNYGDWLAFENNDGRCGLPFDLYNTAFHYQTTNLFMKIADILGHEDDAEQYAARAERIAETFNDRFFDAETAQYGPGTQSSYAVPLYVGLVPDEYVDTVVDRLAEKVRDDGGKLQTGFLGTRPLIHTLVDHSREEVAYEIVSQPERPGWVYMVQQGATTVWERWDSDDRIGDGMNSFNHSPFNFVSEWFYYALAGLRFNESMHGRGAVEIAPAIVDDLEWAEGSIETVNGTLSSCWEQTDEGLILDVEVPWNTNAVVRIPVDKEEVSITEGDNPVWDGSAVDSLPDGMKIVRGENDAIVLEIGSGSYKFHLGR